ncbi:MAG: cytochrome P450, partial [Henriciella sp.]
VLDMHEEMIRITMEIITRTLFTAEIVADNREAIAHDVSMMVTELGRFDMLDAFGAPTWIPRIGGMKGRAAVQRVRALAMQGLQSRKGHTEGRNDLLSLMIEAKDPETGIGLTDDEIADNVVTFIAAGHETTALALTWVLYLIANLPEWQDKLREEVAEVFGDGPLRADGIEKLVLHERVIKEAMRLYPPATAIGRSATENTDLGSLQVTPKDRLVLAIYALHRNERFWDDPNTFNPDRFLPEEEAKRHRYAFIPFSAGPRICIGAKFAMLEAQATLAAIMRAVQFAPDPDHEVSLRSTITLRPATGMPLKLAPL